MRSALLACVLAAVAPTALCQDREFTIDFGHTSSPSTSRGLVWNNVDVTSQGVPLSLVQTNGAPSSVQLSFPPQAAACNYP